MRGWDAAGKGGNIKRITEALDPRGFEVHPIASPEPHEKARHYLWRFWNRLPKTGHVAIFDRTWYGRVMVERLEDFAVKMTGSALTMRSMSLKRNSPTGCGCDQILGTDR